MSLEGIDNFTSVLPNASQGQTRGCDDEESMKIKVVKALAYCLVILLALIGNSIVVAIYYKHRSMRSTTNRLILNMAASDLLLPLIVLPRNLSIIFETGNLPHLVWRIDGTFGEIMCKLIPIPGDVSYAVSIFSLVLIACDRYLAVVWPMSKGLHFTAFRCRILIAATWLAAFALHSPYIYTFYLYQTENNTLCFSQWRRGFGSQTAAYNLKMQTIYFGTVFALIYALPLVIITVLYMSIIFELEAKTRRNAQNNPLEVGRRRRREDKKVITMLLVVLSVFALFYAPFNVYHFVYFFVWTGSGPEMVCGPTNLVFAVYFLSHSTCAINPYIYFIFVRNYRRGFKEILKICFRKNLYFDSRSLEEAPSKTSSRFTSDVYSTSLRSRSSKINSGKGWRVLQSSNCCLEASKTTPESSVIQFETCL